MNVDTIIYHKVFVMPKNGWSYDAFNPLAVKKLRKQTNVKDLNHSFERSTLLIYNDSKCNFLRRIITYRKCVLQHDILQFA